MTLTCHFLIGPPGCGKSTFAKQLAELGNCRIVSTDAIRAQLFGEESIQGNWGAIETEAISQIHSCIAAGQSVIYDATNAKRAWRMDLLGKLSVGPSRAGNLGTGRLGDRGEQGAGEQGAGEQGAGEQGAGGAGDTRILRQAQEGQGNPLSSSGKTRGQGDLRGREQRNRGANSLPSPVLRSRASSSKSENQQSRTNSLPRPVLRSRVSTPKSDSRQPTADSPKKGGQEEQVRWIAWYLQTPLETCKAWNHKRDRVVPPVVIEAMFKSLAFFPPLAAEGFVAVYALDVTAGELNRQDIETKIKHSSPSSPSSSNNKQTQITPHPYSRLLDFDRLMHLISLTIRYPGLGTIHKTAPRLLKRIFNRMPKYATPLDEVTALMGKLSAQIYSDRAALAADLKFLKANGFLVKGGLASVEPAAPGGDGQEKITIPILDNLNFLPHPYSDLAPFERVLKTIRFIINRPMLHDWGEANLQTLLNALQKHYLIEGHVSDLFREDIERVLKPFKILPDVRLPED